MPLRAPKMIGAHLGVPAAGLVTEVDAGFQHLLHADVSHVELLETNGFVFHSGPGSSPADAVRPRDPEPLPKCAALDNRV